MIELTVCPSNLQPGYQTYSPSARRLLFDSAHVSHILSEPKPSDDSAEANEILRQTGRISISGAQPKFSLLTEKGRLRYALGDEQGTFIMKPAPVGYQIINKEYCAANEHLTMQLASQVYGIITAPNALCFFQCDDSIAYITRRFDVSPQGKLRQEDFAALMGYSKDLNGSDYKYSMGSYEECGEIIRRHVKAYLPDLRRLFRLVLFNFITLNDDAHLKNFSLLEQENEFRLAPAYDLINTSLQIWEPRIFALENGLFREGMHLSDTRSVRAADFKELGRRFGLPDKIIEKDLQLMTGQHPLAKKLIDNSFLSEELKLRYFDGYDFRRRMLTF